MNNQNSLAPLTGNEIRKIWYNDTWYFSVVDVIRVLTESKDARTYWKVLKNREPQLVTICNQLKMQATDGRQRLTDTTNTEGVFRIIMSVPSPKAEPLKLWLAQEGKRAMDEAENPELLTERQAELYRAKGYSEEWIGRRVQTIETRKALTDEWKMRGVKENQEFSILTATIAKSTFGLTPTEHREIKGLARQNLRDNMTPLELIFTALGEEMTRVVTIDTDAQGFQENHDAASKGGSLAGKALENLETNYGKKVVSAENYLSLSLPNSNEEPPSSNTNK
jgi:DNA-damage-inducible protein D